MNNDMKVLDLEKFALEQIIRPYQDMIINGDRTVKKSPYSLNELALMLKRRDDWSNLVLDRIYRCGFWFPEYVNHDLVSVIKRYNEERQEALFLKKK